MREILNFMNTNDNWKEVLQEPPYFIKVKEDGEYVLLQYTQLASDFSIQLVRECRGSIFKKNKLGKYECVCAPFIKFFNLGEPYADDIDWDTASVTEKVDGSLIKVWYDNDSWHISTNGTIDAFKAKCQNNNYSYGELFLKAIDMDIDSFMQDKSTSVTYLFELVSPFAPLTVQYDTTAIYLLNIIGNATFNEYGNKLEEPFKNCKLPKVYRLNSLTECLAAVNAMGSDEEGFVVKDDNNHRVKIKSPEFLKAFHFINNNQCSIKRVLMAIFGGYYDDMISYLKGEVRDFAESVYNAYNKYVKLVFDAKCEVFENANNLNRKDYWETYRNTEVFDYKMRLKTIWDNTKTVLEPMDYIKYLYRHRYDTFEKFIAELLKK